MAECFFHRTLYILQNINTYLLLSTSKMMSEVWSFWFLFLCRKPSPTHSCLKIYRIFLIIVKISNQIFVRMCVAVRIFILKKAFLLVFRKPWDFWTVVFLKLSKSFNYYRFYCICSIYSSLLLRNTNYLCLNLFLIVFGCLFLAAIVSQLSSISLIFLKCQFCDFLPVECFIHDLLF